MLSKARMRTVYQFLSDLLHGCTLHSLLYSLLEHLGDGARAGSPGLVLAVVDGRQRE